MNSSNNGGRSISKRKNRPKQKNSPWGKSPRWLVERQRPCARNQGISKLFPPRKLNASPTSCLAAGNRKKDKRGSKANSRVSRKTIRRRREKKKRKANRSVQHSCKAMQCNVQRWHTASTTGGRFLVAFSFLPWGPYFMEKQPRGRKAQQQ